MFPVRIYNDLHNEFDVYDVPVLPGESDTILSLAGDIYDRKHIMQWLHPLSKRFKAIILVLGNHDNWKGDYHRIPIMISHYLRDHNITNVHHLHNSHVTIGDYTFFGGTMWTDYNKQDPLTLISYAPFHDYKKIRTDNYMRRISPKFLLSQHFDFKLKLKQFLNDPVNAGKKVMVVTHHAPCALSIHEKYRGQHIHNGYYYSDMSDLILDHPQIILWHHGHVHQKFYYQVGDASWVVCNPRGYIPREPVREFDPELTIDLDLF